MGIISPLQQSLETSKEMNPFENGLFRQSAAPLLDNPSIILPEEKGGSSTTLTLSNHEEEGKIYK
jgi:hypothetical protein